MTRSITALRLEVSKLQEELCLTRAALEATRLENARLMAEAERNCERFQHAQASTSRTDSVSRYCAPGRQAGDPTLSPSTATESFYCSEQGIQAYNGFQIGVQQQDFYGHDPSRHW
jgi:hypothetical protein